MKKSKRSAATARRQIRAYIGRTPPDARRALRKIREIVHASARGAEEAFSYRIPGFRLDGRPLVWYAAFKTHCSLYPITGNIRRAHAAALKGFKTATGTVQFPLAKPIPVGLVRRLVKARIAEVRAKTAT